MTTSAPRGVTYPANAPGRGRDLTLLRPGWPLSVLFLGFPLWWVTGLSTYIFVIMAVPMAAHLLRRGAIAVPRGFGVWLVFLVWMAGGVFMLGADAPGAVPDGFGPGRLMVFAYRAAWYLTVTIVLLYIGNLREDELPSRRVGRLLGFMFVVVTAGGLLGVLAPHVEFRSLMEIMLPARLAGEDFVSRAIHPVAADVQILSGSEQTRPIAPFAYANSWGANYALYLPFFVLTWLARGNGWRRVVGPMVLVASLWPVIHSLNRGLWLGLTLVATYLVLRLAAQGRMWALQGLAVGAVAAAVVFVSSPLQELMSDRLETPHSNDRRVQLYVETISSTLQGSPLLGFGSTRDVQGNFASVAGGETAQCDGCGVPPLGTQGHLWLVLFSQGVVGVVLFCSFFAVRFRRHWRESSPYAVTGCCVLLFFAFFLLVYDLVEAPLFTVMTTVALLWRLERNREPTEVAR